MGDRRARHCSSYRYWHRRLAGRCRFHVVGKGRAAWSAIPGGAGLRKVGLWRSAGVVCCCPRYRKERSRSDPCRGQSVPDLQAPGRDGATLLNFAVRQSWQRPESVEAGRTLLSLGADPNYTNGKPNSLAMADAGHSSAPVLRSMLEAGGNANTRDEFGRPMILMNWYLGYYKDQARSRLELLLDHGADVNSAMPNDRSDSGGYPLLLYRTAMGVDDNLAYSDALLLLERGADPTRAGADGMTFGKILADHRAHFQTTHKSAPAEFDALWDWAEKHGVVQHGQ